MKNLVAGNSRRYLRKYYERMDIDGLGTFFEVAVVEISGSKVFAEEIMTFAVVEGVNLLVIIGSKVFAEKKNNFAGVEGVNLLALIANELLTFGGNTCVVVEVEKRNAVGIKRIRIVK